MANPTYQVCGIPITAIGPMDAATQVVDSACAGTPVAVHLCNAYTLSLIDRDEVLRIALVEANLNLPDGTPVAWLGRNHGTRGPVRGPQLVGDVARLGVERGLRHYLYGGQAGVAAEMADTIVAHTGAHIAGLETPPFHDIDDAELDELASRVQKSGANVMWVGIGTPRQDYLVPRLARRLSMPVVPVGAAFDFWAGRVEEAPKWIHGTGVEWLHRLASEPRRLWRRYLLGNPRFLRIVIAYRFKERRLEHNAVTGIDRT